MPTVLIVLLLLLLGPAVGYALIVGRRRSAPSALAVESLLDGDDPRAES